MKYENPIEDHGFVFPDLAEFPDYAQEPRHEGDYSLDPMYQAFVNGNPKDFVAAVKRFVPMDTKWAGRLVSHFNFYLRSPLRRSMDVTGDIMASMLYERGIAVTSVRTAALIEMLKPRIEKLLAHPDWKPPIGTMDRGERVDPYIVRRIGEVLAPVVKSASLYNGRELHVSAALLHVSTPTDTHWKQFFQDATTTPEWTNAHIDPKEDVIKAIIYLEECSKENGAFGYVPYSHRFVHDPIQEIFGRAISTGSYCPTPEARKSVFALPAFLRVSHNFGRCLIDGHPMADWLRERIVYYTTDGGNCVVFDPGAGMHQGGITTSGRRVALQVLMK